MAQLSSPKPVPPLTSSTQKKAPYLPSCSSQNSVWSVVSPLPPAPHPYPLTTSLPYQPVMKDSESTCVSPLHHHHPTLAPYPLSPGPQQWLPNQAPCFVVIPSAQYTHPSLKAREIFEQHKSDCVLPKWLRTTLRAKCKILGAAYETHGTWPAPPRGLSPHFTAPAAMSSVPPPGHSTSHFPPCSLLLGLGHSCSHLPGICINIPS